ncbi:hypothetical protein GCM10008995_16590 [Halobellus salinus]|uniref:Uncharacterized protein n=1 Tax=Halobellus salinus TaxID=931585 RepID=A0A830EGC8_9EURY|nr:hypothetical protein [Halobellus salinus]GGJ07438.1 hypothetical protein GCM10008995_16590 [Halobellus salinus]SMP25985.1 hypothetical protein SAMN06265347_11148 [Halobellus salinus]
MPMRKLRNCDFCGGDAAGVYEVLPPELAPTEAEQRRLVLCSDCAGTLETVVDPLLERLGVETGEDASTADGGAPASEAPADAPASETASGTGTESPSEAATADPDAPGPDDAATASDPVNAGGSDDGIGFAPDSPADPSTGGSKDDNAATDGAVHWDDVEPTTPTSGESESDGGGVPDEPTEPAIEARGSQGAPDGRADDPDGSEAAATGRPDEPEEFRTVMRLLGNREFPVDRDTIVELAAGAYELDEGHVHRIVDHAVDRGVIADDGGTLRRD